MKRLLPILLVLILVVCSFSVIAEEKLTFGYIAYMMSDNWNEYSAKSFEYAAEKFGVEVMVLDAGNDIAQSISCMETLIQAEVDGISVFPISPEQGAQLITMANEAGIPITIENIDVADVADEDEYIAAVACVYGDIGYAAIEWLAKNVEDAKMFYCAGAVGGGVFEAYMVGVEKALADYADSLEMVGMLNSEEWSTEDGLNLTTNFINSGVEFNCIFANSDQIAQGCYQACEEAGIEVPIVSTGGSPDAYAFLEDGIEAANMTAPVSIQGIQTFKNLYEYVVDGTVPDPKFQSLPVIPVSGDDLSAWIDWADFEAAYAYVYGE
ncbi:MAG: sugar ABC transporter substrate-binding protein [Clostridia bacterium]|nr:sugar ABC transporter substrate-binding protein [Clostridia bacterium]